MIVHLSHAAAPGAQRNPARRRAASRLAALAASASLVAIASPAYAQCVEGPPNNYTCSGTTNVPQIIADDDATVVAAPNFEVDTSGNGNGMALQVTGNGLISFTGSPNLTGAGVRFSAIGDSGSSVGAISVASSGRIFADGDYGLRLDNNGSGGSTIATWVGRIENSGGSGVFARNFAGTGELSLLVNQITARDQGVRVDYDGSSSATVTLLGQVIGLNGTGLSITTGASAGLIDVTTKNVTGGTYGIVLDNNGTGLSKIDAGGIITGMGNTGLYVNSGPNTLGIDIRAEQVYGADYGVSALNHGTGDTTIVTTEFVKSGTEAGVSAFNYATARDISITTDDVTGGLVGISATNSGTGSTTVIAKGDVIGLSHDGLNIEAGTSATDMLVDVQNVTGAQRGIFAYNSGSGSTVVRAAGTVTGTTGQGIEILNSFGGQDVLVDAVDVTGTTGIDADNNGNGMTVVNATGTVTGTAIDGIGIAATTDSAAGGLRVTAIDVSGGGRGIDVKNYGSDTLVATTGLVSGGEVGLAAFHGFFATNLTVRVAEVQGIEEGIFIDHRGNGIASLIAEAVTADNGIGVRVEASVNNLGLDLLLGEVTAGAVGVHVVNSGHGVSKVETTGVVTGGASGIRITNGVTATDIDLRTGAVNGQEFGMLVSNSGIGNTSVVASGMVASATNAGIAVVNDATAGDLSVSATDVVSRSGIVTLNNGVGATAIAASGNVVGFGFDGMRIDNGATASDLRIDAFNVEGQKNGIILANNGTGVTAVRANGAVTGTTGNGIQILAGATSDDVTVDVATVTGSTGGVVVTNYGTGSARVTASGAVGGLAPDGTGIAVESGTGSTNILVSAGAVTGGARGIDTWNNGSGETLIVTTGLVSGGMTGIRARNNAAATSLAIRTAAVQAVDTGIVAQNLGTGTTTVRAEGTVTAQGEAGIGVSTGAAAGDATVIAGTVTGGLVGIWVDNGGLGAASITATGTVSGTDFGILAKNDAGATDLTIRAANVQGGSNAVVAENLGSGKTQVTTTGNVSAVTQTGIRVFAGADADDISVEAVNASGGISGISVVNLGLGDTSVTVNGVVHGGTRGVEAFADGNQRVSIFNNGTIRNSSGLGASRAIGASGGLVGIANVGTLTGIVEIAGDQSLMLNAGTWQSIGGTSLFATIDDTLFNTIGTIVAGVAPGAVETTTWQGLEKFRNGGVLRLQDGGTGDLVLTSAASTFIAGSTLAVDIGGATAADLFRTTGTLQIEAGSRLHVTTTQPLVLHGKHVIAQADGGLTGQFAFEDQFLTAFAGLRDGYTATTAYVEFAQLKPLAAGGLTPNQKETGGGADSLPEGNPLKDALILLPTDAAAQEAFDQLSGEIHPSARGAMFDDARLVRNAVLDRLAGGAPGWSVWGRAFGATGMNDGDTNAARMQRDSKGGVIGIDGGFGAATIGIAGGWSDSDLRIDRRASNGAVETVHAMAYAGANLGPVRLRGGAGYAWTTTQTRRHIAFQGFAAQPHARYRGSVLQAYGEASYQLPLGGGHVEPFVNLTAVRASTDGFTETGGSPAALTGKAIREERVASTLGLRLETPAAGPVSVRGSIGWNHGWGDLDPVGVHAFAGGAPFTILGAAGSRDSALARFDAQMRLSSNVTLSIGYDGVLGSHGDDHSVTGGLRIVF